MDTDAQAAPGKDHTPIPIYKLYGYGNVWTAPDLMYCETIAAQEKLHNWHVKPHKHMDLFQILSLEAGRADVHLDGTSRTMLGGEMVLIPQMVVHGFQFDPGSVGYILTVTYALMAQIGQKTGMALTTASTPAFLRLTQDEDSQHTKLTWRRLNKEYRSPQSPQRGALLESLLSCILIWVHRNDARRTQAATHDKVDSSRHLTRFAQLIEEHYTQHHQVADYASRIGITAAHLNVITQMHTGKSALRLIHERLLLEARRELVYTTRTVSTISYSLGFADPGYFTRFFKRVSGLSPRDFRRLTACPDP